MSNSIITPDKYYEEHFQEYADILSNKYNKFTNKELITVGFAVKGTLLSIETIRTEFKSIINFLEKILSYNEYKSLSKKSYALYNIFINFDKYNDITNSYHFFDLLNTGHSKSTRVLFDEYEYPDFTKDFNILKECCDIITDFYINKGKYIKRHITRNNQNTRHEAYYLLGTVLCRELIGIEYIEGEKN